MTQAAPVKGHVGPVYDASYTSSIGRYAAKFSCVGPSVVVHAELQRKFEKE